MFWADRVAKEIIASGKYKPYWVDDMKTPSGRVHVGALRGVVIHDLIHKALLDQGVSATFTYVFEDHDPMDEISHQLDRKIWSKYLGQPLFTVPSPDKRKSSNFARYIALEFQDVFEKIGCSPEIIWVSDLYKAEKMNEDIKLCLDKAETIRKIYEELYKKKIAKDWYPFQVVCPNCGKESTTKVKDWDGREVSFSCQIDAVSWTKGCGTSGKISPFSSEKRYAGKLSWKVEWAVKWKVIGVTIEGAGKDHMSAGGSHDVARLICERVIDYPTPYPVAYEFFLIGGKKMSSSKGLGSSAKETADTLPSHLLRFLMVRTQINQAINFCPSGWVVPDLFDEYDRCWKSYITGKDQDLARIFELSQIEKTDRKEIYLPRFRTIAQIVQFPGVEVVDYFTKEKGNQLSNDEKDLLSERVKYAKIWLEKYAPFEAKIVIKPDVSFEQKTLNTAQKKYLGKIAKVLEQVDKPDRLEQELYQQASNLNLSAKEAFAAIYLVLIGKRGGPKAASFILSLDRAVVIKRFKEVANL